MGQFRRFGLLDQLDVFGLGIDNAAKEVLSAVSACPARPPDTGEGAWFALSAFWFALVRIL